MAQMRFQMNEDIQEKFQQQIEILEKYKWEKGGLMIHPPKSQEELANESVVLHHTVVCYLGKISDGKTAILFIRKVTEPDKPFYTLELNPKTLAVVQCRTDHNASYEKQPEIMGFVETWLKEVVHNDKREKTT
ncbi:PcfJ domain-containing protein [Anaerotignum sp. MB30-C6]|uniref:PcfJ domain-containing protein n=1 Tax=Anaerotignum sp. MB30-C6 TaxID=3070814 RepID=UPI0027DD5F8A|nr:PcfJ domain-containing protein [Anaerotignum sp. MB30-C6]WMI81576.1 PcfJ domain-containing protein [Anaerotignum sp. MB30-C6]